MTDQQDKFTTRPKRLAAAAPAQYDEDGSPMPDMGYEQQNLDDLCERYMAWKATRRLYGPSPNPPSILGQLSGTRSRPLKVGGPDAFCSAEMAALHLAYLSQPDALDKRVFDLYYVHRIAPIKVAAAALKVSRSHFYLVLSEFRKRLSAAMAAILDDELSKVKKGRLKE